MGDKKQKTPLPLQVIYLHGFASGPNSSKAVYYAQALNKIGITSTVPDLNKPSFEQMTLTSCLEVLSEAIEKCPRHKRLVIIGSSMGGLLATIKSRELENLAGLILLAPGFGLTKRWPELIGEQVLQTWKKTGTLDVFDYEAKKTLPLSYKFFEDINKYETEDLLVSVPTLIFHGKNDETVPLAASESFAKRNQDYVRLHTMDDDHQLISSLPDMWMSSSQFLSSL